ncbi:MAG: glutaminyl-peptide cyclotransferase [Clostridia bacterium]|nr:glutaminyl-peptide cyclotransferase [Clostridia bacterium]
MPEAGEEYYTYVVINQFPHDPQAFTQGFLYSNGYFYEGTGLYGRSSLRKVKLETGEVIKERELTENLFGEGIALYKNKIIQLTWRENLGLVYDRESFAVLEVFSYPTEGWGLAYDGKHLIMSDGSSTLTFLDPETFAPVRRIQVTSSRGPVENLNELEYIKGEIYANVWLTDYIVRIDPQTGRVTGWIDLSSLLPRETVRGVVDVLNGIAYDHEQDRLFVTGKLWPFIFEIRLVPVDAGKD